jgi:hypothetical protein
MMIKPKSAHGDWSKQLRLDMMFAEKCLLDGGQVPAMFIVHTPTAQHLIPTPWQNSDEKATYQQLVRLMCVAYGATALTAITEVWVRRVMRHDRETDAEYHARIEAYPPSEAHDRTEAVFVMICWREQNERKVLFESREITRRANGKPEGLAPITWGGDESYDELGGTMTEILPDRVATPDEVAAARSILSRYEVQSEMPS